jgi:hypothetical protein
VLLLLERLRPDYPNSPPPPGQIAGFDCAQLHLVDALRAITNNDQGMYYLQWKTWWQANQNLPQSQWVLNGFAAEGLHVARPIDENISLELIEVMGRRQDYLAINAQRQLARVPLDQLSKWVGLASLSQNRFSRLGAVKVFSQIDLSDNEDLLRSLAKDASLEIRREALTTLNDHLRELRSAAPANARLLLPANEQNWIRGLCFANGLLIVAFRNGEVEAFHTTSFKRLWTRRVFEGAGDRRTTATI